MSDKTDLTQYTRKNHPAKCENPTHYSVWQVDNVQHLISTSKLYKREDQVLHTIARVMSVDPIKSAFLSKVFFGFITQKRFIEFRKIINTIDPTFPINKDWSSDLFDVTNERQTKINHNFKNLMEKRLRIIAEEPDRLYNEGDLLRILTIQYKNMHHTSP